MAYSYFDYEGTDTTIQTDILCVSTEYAGDTVFKQFFMDYVKKIGFYNGS